MKRQNDRILKEELPRLVSETPGVGDGQEGLVCCDSWGRKELDMTERLNGTESNYTPNPGIKPVSPKRSPSLQGDSLQTVLTGKPRVNY